MTDVLDERAAISCEEITPKAPRLYRFADLIEDFAADVQARYDAKEQGLPLGPVSSFPTLDALMGHAFMPGLHVIHGGPGTGKTALALQIAATCGTPALFVSCEIDAIEIMRRLAARVTGTFLQRFKTGEMTPAAAADLARRACATVPLLALVDGSGAWPKPEWLQQQAEAVKGDSRHLLIVVDSLHTWASRAPGAARSTEYDTLNTALGALEQLAGSVKAPLLTIGERNRGGMEKGGMGAGKGSSRIEYAGESVISMNTDYDGNGRPIPFDANGEREVTLWIEKNRHGEGGKVSLLFHGKLQRFREG